MGIVLQASIFALRSSSHGGRMSSRGLLRGATGLPAMVSDLLGKQGFVHLTRPIFFVYETSPPQTGSLKNGRHQ